MTYEVFIPLWAHIAVLPVFAILSTFVVVRVIWTWYQGHMNRRVVARRIAAIREGLT